MGVIIKKIIVEARFPAVFKFREIAYSYFQGIIEQYPIIEEGNLSVALISDYLGSKILCERNRLAVGKENIDDPTSFEVELKNLMELATNLGIKRCDRLGVRVWLLAPFKNLSREEAIEKYRDDQLNKNNLILDPEFLSDFAVILEGKIDESFVRLQEGVVDKNEIKNRSDFLFERDPEVALNFDIDNILGQQIAPLRRNVIKNLIDRSIDMFVKHIEKNNDILET